MTFDAYTAGVLDVVVKTAARKKTKTEQPRESVNVVPYATTVGGAGVAYAGKGMATGTKRVYHGTSRDAWKKIREQGLLAHKGGIGGAGAAVGNKRFIENSRGKVHVTGMSPIAYMFSRYSGEKGGGGKVVTIDMPYDLYRKMEPDPDMNNGFNPVIQRNLASRGTFDIPEEYISGAKRTDVVTRGIRRAKALPAYIKKYPGRFGAGLAITGAGLTVAGMGAKRAIEDYKQKRRGKK